MQDSLRMTRQRKIIVEELCKVTSHPTAYELCQMVRKQLPRISLGTVYRNLEILSRRGEITKIEGEEMRFDGNIDRHYHLRCQQCGCIEDVHMEIIQGVDQLAEAITGGRIYGHQLEFAGLCKQCC